MRNAHRRGITQKRGITLSLIGLALALTSSLFPTHHVAAMSRKDSTPLDLFNDIVHEANKGDPIQETALDNVSRTDSAISWPYTIARTLDSIRIKAAPYLQWFMFVWLSLSVIYIIYAWFQLVTSATSDYDLKKARGKIKNVIIGVLVITGFYIIIRVALSLVAYILQ